MLIATLLNVIGPVFLVIAIGAVFARFVPVDVQPINRLALYTAVPALAFRTLADTQVEAGAVARLVAAYLLFLVAMAVLTRLLGGALAGPERRGLIATSMFGNAANMMLPVSLFAFGEDGVQRALILYIATSLLMFSVGPMILGGEAKPGKAIRTVLGLPVLWACLAGLGVNLAGVELPQGLARGVSLLADAAVPMVLLTLGVQVARFGAIRPTAVNWLGAGVKLLAGPALGWGIGALVGLRGVDLAVLTLLAAMPPAVNNFMLALEFGGEADQVGRTVILATIGALVSLPVVVTLIAV